MRFSRNNYARVQWHHLAVGCCCMLLFVGPVAAQTDVAPPATPAETTSRPAPVEESPLITWVLPDEDGKLVEMPGFTFPDFERAWLLLQGLAQQDPRPRFSIQWLSLVGEVTDGHAELLLTARVYVRDPHWVRVPLRLDQGMVREPLESPDSVEAFLHPQPEEDGYVCYIRGEPDQQHTIKLKVMVPLGTAGDRSRLALRLPRATSSELKLTVPLGEVTAEASEGTTLLPPASTDDSTELTILGVGGDFRLSWYQPEADAGTVPVVLQADGAVSTRMDGQTITWNANLSVRSFGAPFDHFQLRLPPHSELVPENTEGYTLAPVETAEADPSIGRLVEVRLDQKTSGPVDVRIAARRAEEGTAANDWVDLAGFGVVDAVRQWGHLAVAVPSDWQVLWGPQRGVQRIDQLPEPLRRDDVVAGFEYSTQPALLQARLVPKTTRLSVEPEYVVLAGPERIDLQGRLRYSIRGAKVYALRVSLPGWQLDAVEPEDVIALDGVELDADGELHLPLVQPTRGDLEIRLSAHRENTPPVGETDPVSLELPLPRPHADTSSAALVAVLADDNLELVPDPARTTGLVRQRAAPALELPSRQQAPLFYRGELADAVLAASLRRLPQRIEATTTSRVVLRASGAEVEQRFGYTVLHQPAERLLLEVPDSLPEKDAVEVWYEGEAVALRPLEDQSAAADESFVLMQADLPEARIGPCELVVKYSVPLSPLPERGWVPVSVPLLLPHLAGSGVNRLVLEEDAEMFAEVSDESWNRSDREAATSPAAQSEEAFTTTGKRREIRLRIGPPDARRLGTTVVERAWVQTWLIRTERSGRQDRAAFRVRTSRKRLEVQLPEGTAMEQVFVWLNQERVEGFAIDGTTVFVPLPENGTQQSYHLELGYHFLEPVDRQGPLSVELPQLGEQVWVRRMYWQLVLPRHEHVVVAPAGFTSESPWTWKGYLFARRPLLEQPELEAWAGAARRTPVSHETNRYLFGTSGYPQEVVLRTANRSWIVFGASGLALVAGLVLIYVPAGRRPGTLFVAAIGLACVGALYPAPTLLVAQAASLGLGLTLLAGLLERSVARRRTALPPTEAGLPSESDSTLTQHEIAWTEDPTATQTAAIGVGPEAPQDEVP